MLFISFFVVFLPFLHADQVTDVIRPLLASNDAVGMCKNVDEFRMMIFRQCPLFEDTCCITRYLYDLDFKAVLSCSLVGPFENNSLYMLTSAEFLKLVSTKDACGRPWCMASLMYSKSCIFSANVADRYAELAELFPQLLIVAVDVSSKDSSVDTLINQYGIAATPVVALWENGLPRFKVTREPDLFDSLVNDINTKSGLKPVKNWTSDACVDQECHSDKENLVLVNKTNILRQQFTIDQELQHFDWYLFVAILGLTLQGLYLFETKRQNGIPWKSLEFGF